MNVSTLDALIIGAGPAGLTAATYLARFRRNALIIEAHSSRAHWIPRSHNIPGFPQGIAGSDLLDEMRAQALRYGTVIRPGKVTSLRVTDRGFSATTESETIRSRYVVLATGIIDRLPDIQGAVDAMQTGLLRVCPICDAFEATAQTIAVIGNGEHGAREAEFLRTYSHRVSLVHIGPPREIEANRRLTERGIEVIETEVTSLALEKNELRLQRAGDRARAFAVCYAALGCNPQNELAVTLGAKTDQTGTLTVNGHQETSVPGLYAAGDVVRGLNQVVVAAAEAAIAATDIHNRLRSIELTRMQA